MILPEGYELEFVVPSGSPEVFKNLIEYIDKEISLILCGENEAGQAEAGSRASSQVANTVRVVRASEISEAISHTLTQTLVRWIVDLNFGTDVAAPSLTREFRIEESPLTMPDVSLMIQSGYTPRKEWIERHFRVELEEKEVSEEESTETTYDPQEDQDLFGSVMEQPTEATPEESSAVAATDLQAAADETALPEGAAPEESQADAIGQPAVAEQAAQPPVAEQGADSDIADSDIEALIAMMDEPDEEREKSTKPFGNQIITEDEDVEMDK
jgi:hypothetical protein